MTDVEKLRLRQYEEGIHPAFRRIDFTPITGKTPAVNR